MFCKSSDNKIIKISAVGKANSKSIANNNSIFKKESCCNAAITIAKSNEPKALEKKAKLEGNEESFVISSYSSGISKILDNPICESTLNDYEECKATIEVISKATFPGFPSSSKIGWIDDNLYVNSIKGKANQKSIEVNSDAMKETTCIDSVKLNAFANAIFSLTKNKLTIETILPEIELKSCVSSDSYATCECLAGVYDDNLRGKLEEIIKQSAVTGN